MVFMDNFFLIAFAFMLGFILQKLKIFSEDMPLFLNKFVIYISLPALILVSIPKLTFSLKMFIPPLVAWIVMIVSAVAVLIISRMLKFSKQEEGALMLVGVLTNSSFVGIPMITAYLGEKSLGYIMMYDQLGTAIALGTYGTLVVAYYAHIQTVSFANVVKKVVAFPPFIVLVIAFISHGHEYPQPFEHTLGSLSSTVIPLALVAAGLQLKLIMPRHEILPFIAAIVVKLIIAPAVAIAVCYFLRWNGLASHVSVMEAGMPPMITAGAVASIAGLAPRLSAAIVGYGILLSFITSAVLFKII